MEKHKHCVRKPNIHEFAIARVICSSIHCIIYAYKIMYAVVSIHDDISSHKNALKI